MTNAFDLSVTRDGRSAIVCLRGEIDLASRDALNAAVAESLTQPDLDELVVDLADVSFLDSAGLAGLVLAHNAAVRHGLRFRLHGAAGSVLHTLRLTGLDRLGATSQEDQP